jgi:hypothetical protein
MFYEIHHHWYSTKFEFQEVVVFFQIREQLHVCRINGLKYLSLVISSKLIVEEPGIILLPSVINFLRESLV